MVAASGVPCQQSKIQFAIPTLTNVPEAVQAKPCDLYRGRAWIISLPEMEATPAGFTTAFVVEQVVRVAAMSYTRAPSRSVSRRHFAVVAAPVAGATPTATTQTTTDAGVSLNPGPSEPKAIAPAG